MFLFFKIDARTKLFCVLLLTLLVFLADNLAAAVCLLVFFIILRFAVKIPFHGTKYLKNLTFLAVFIILIQTIFGPGGAYIVSLPFGGSISLKPEGFILGLVITCRLFSLMLLLPLFIKTTPHNQIAAGLCSLGVNYRSAFIMTTAFNFIPFFREEAGRIMDAQKLRGLRAFDKKSFFSGVKAYSGLLIPLMLGAMRKAQISSAAMDSRAFGIYKTRTWIDKPKMKALDYWIIFSCLVFSVILLFINYYL